MKQIFLIVMIIFTTQVTLAQVKTVKGTVTDAVGAPLPSANIKVKGESVGTTTDFDGGFTIQVQAGKTLEVSFLGFETKSVVVGDSVMQLKYNCKNLVLMLLRKLSLLH